MTIDTIAARQALDGLVQRTLVLAQLPAMDAYAARIAITRAPDLDMPAPFPNVRDYAQALALQPVMTATLREGRAIARALNTALARETNAQRRANLQSTRAYARTVLACLEGAKTAAKRQGNIVSAIVMGRTWIGGQSRLPMRVSYYVGGLHHRCPTRPGLCLLAPHLTAILDQPLTRDNGTAMADLLDHLLAHLTRTPTAVRRAA